MLTDGIKNILNKLIIDYGFKEAINVFEESMRGKYYREKDEDLIQNCLRYIKDKWIDDRNKKISSILEKRILNFKDFNYKFF